MVKFDYSDVEGFKLLAEGFMKYHGLRGLEVLVPYVDDQVCFRACGKGRHKTGIEIWSGMNDMLKGDDREVESCQGNVE